MKYKCSICSKSQPCVLEFASIGETTPNQCPFYTKDITGFQAEARWKLVKDKPLDK